MKINAMKGWVAFTVAAVLVFSVINASILCTKGSGFGDTLSEVCFATEKKTVIIDAGHGGEDCGAIGINGAYEKDLNLDITFTLGKYLSAAGYEVIYTRTEDRLLYTEQENIKGFRKVYDLKNRLKIAK